MRYLERDETETRCSLVKGRKRVDAWVHSPVAIVGNLVTVKVGRDWFDGFEVVHTFERRERARTRADNAPAYKPDQWFRDGQTKDWR